MTDQENLAIVREAYAAFGRGDVAGAISNYADDIDWAMPGSPETIPYAGKRHGREQVAQFYSTFAQTEEIEEMQLQDFIAHGDRVLVFGHYRGRVKSTERSYTKDFIHVVTLRDTKVIRFREYVASDDMYAAFVT